jgi:hypothetical protein
MSMPNGAPTGVRRYVPILGRLGVILASAAALVRIGFSQTTGDARADGHDRHPRLDRDGVLARIGADHIRANVDEAVAAHLASLVERPG